MRGKPSEFVVISDIVDCAGRVAKGAVEVDRADKKLSPRSETCVGKDRKGMVNIEFERNPASGDSYPRANTAKNRITAARARKRLLLFDFAVLLEPPTHVNTVDMVGIRQCSGE